MPPEQTSPPQPESSRVEVQRDEQGVSIYIPPLRFSKYGPGLCFGLCFSSLPGLLMGAMVYRFVSHVTSGREVEWQDLLVTFGIVAILLIFLAAGLVIVVTSLTEATQRTKISIRNDWLSASQKYLLRGWQETWPADAIHSLNVVNARDQNHPDRFHLELRLRTPGDFRKLVENRSQAEVEWIAGLLCQDLHCEVGSGSATQTEDRPNWKELTTSQPDSKHFLPGETSDLQQDILAPPFARGATACIALPSIVSTVRTAAPRSCLKRKQVLATGATS